MSSDLNLRYLDGWPISRRAWRDIAGLDAVLVLVAAPDEVPEQLRDDPQVHVFEPVEGIHTGLQAQCIRLLYPALVETDGAVLTSDVDMVPLSRSYFCRWAARIDERHFLAYRDVLVYGYEIPICYTAALPRTWRDVFGVTCVDDVRTRLVEWGTGLRYDGVRGGHGWDTDQVMLYQTLVARGRRCRDVWILDDRFTGFHRLDGGVLASEELQPAVRRAIARGRYTDYHLLHPLAENGRLNERVVELAIAAQARGGR